MPATVKLACKRAQGPPPPKIAHFLGASQSTTRIHSLTHSFVLFFYPQLYLECLLEIGYRVQHREYSVGPTEVKFHAPDSNSETCHQNIVGFKRLELKIK